MVTQHTVAFYCCLFIINLLGVTWLLPTMSHAQEDPAQAALNADALRIQQAIQHLDFDTEWATPAGLDRLPSFPQDNAPTKERLELGRRLFFDRLLSVDQTKACADCHQPAQGFANHERTPTGVGGVAGRRNAPTLLNAVYSTTLFWDGRVDSLESQALEPIENEAEMANSVDEVLRRLEAHDQYPALFAAAYPDGLSRENLARAIACFERSLLSGASKIDRFQTAQESDLTQAQRQGLWIFESKGGCWKCHSGKNYTDQDFHNTGVSWGTEPLDLGRFEKTGVEADRGRFRTPTLRDVARTAPYMHDGSMANLIEVVEFYDRGGNSNPHLDPKLKPLNLTDKEKQDLVAFLEALNGQYYWDHQDSSETPTSSPDADK